MRSIFLLIVGVLAFGSVRAQVIDKKNVDSNTTRIDTLKKQVISTKEGLQVEKRSEDH